jgi:hypothetical protein
MDVAKEISKSLSEKLVIAKVRVHVVEVDLSLTCYLVCYSGGW